MSARAAVGARHAGAEAQKAWSSGRVLTAEQRARKQEVDRKANRFIKKEVQDRLALLEARVLQLEAEQPRNDLPHHARRGTVGDAQGILATGSPTEIKSMASGSLASNEIPVWEAGTNSFEHGNAATSAVGLAWARHANPIDVDDVPNASTTAPGCKHPELTDTYTAGKALPNGRDLTMFLNHLVKHVRSIPPDSVCYDDPFNQDVIITAIIKGWKHALSKYENICPLWEVLQIVDFCVFKDCNLVERISCLRMLHKRYMFETKNVTVPVEGPLPLWFQPQLSEELIIYDEVVDHLTWPKLRERLMASQTDILTNQFWTHFARNIRVGGRFEPLDVMGLSTGKSLYYLSPAFEASILDMANWRMDMDFFYRFPSLSEDIPPANYMPLRQIAPRFGLSERMLVHQSLQQQSPGTFFGELPGRASHAPQETTALHEILRELPCGSWNGFYPGQFS